MSKESITLGPAFGETWVSTLLATWDGLTDALGDLDRRAGDGDFGTNLATAVRLSRANVSAASPANYVDWVAAVSRGFLGVGGTSGPLFGMLFRDLGRCVAGDAAPTAAEFGSGIVKGLATVQHYGEAEPGHKTMVDALAPAAEATRGPSDEAPAYLERIAAAAVEGAESTRDIVARRGRASYVGEAARGVLDPGAAALAVVFQSAAAGGKAVDTAWITASPRS